MKIGENKLVKINAFDLLDTESLEEYLSKMAKEGWMISKVSKSFLTFEKIEPKLIKFFVGITDLLEDNYANTKDYIEKAKEENLEYICGNEKFQIFINKGSKRKVDKKKLKFSKVFTQEFGIISNIFFALMPFLLSDSFFGESFVQSISNNFLMIFVGIGSIVILFNLILIILKLIKYKKIMKEDNHSFEEIRHSKYSYLLNKYAIFTGTLFLIFTVISVLGVTLDNSSNISKDEMPLSLEDFNVPIQEIRECSKSRSSSPFAKYDEYYDYTYEETSDKEAFTLSYSVFESKYDKVMNKAVNSLLEEYREYEVNYEKLTDKDELKSWGAKEVYLGDFIYDRIVVYDDRIITISSNLDYNKENINIIKKVLLK